MPEKPGRLWEKGLPLNEEMHRLTVGNDPVLDAALIEWDCVGSAAHARMLAHVGILNDEEARSLCKALSEIRELGKKGEFTIPYELEDAHTAIETRLTEMLGEPGRKIHTGRSRNDQVILTMRLYLRHQVLDVMQGLVALTESFIERRRDLGNVPMPGYTHLQPAMPSSIGMWLDAFIEAGLEQVREGFGVLEILDENPLGAAAGFGSGLALDRGLVARLLGFSRIQRSVIDVQNSRGRKEERVLQWLGQIAGVYEKFAWDVLLFATREYGYMSLPPELTTGSSIMPQKRNLDICELLRGKAGRVRGSLAELMFTASKLPTSYHRDLQYTKEPALRGVTETKDILAMAELVVLGLRVNEERLKAAMYPELFATYEAYRQVAAGVPFRDAYRKTAEIAKTGSFDCATLQSFYDQVLKDAEIGFEAARAEHAHLSDRVAGRRREIDETISALFASRAS